MVIRSCFRQFVTLILGDVGLDVSALAHGSASHGLSSGTPVV